MSIPPVTIHPGTVNAVMNPRLEANANGWTFFGFGSSVNRITDDGVSGTTCIEITPGSGSNTGLQLHFGHAITAAKGQTWTFSMEIKGSQPLTLALRFVERGVDNAGLVTSDPTLFEVGDDWGPARYAATYTITHDAAVKFTITLLTVATNQPSFRATDFQAEMKAYATPFVIGSRSDVRSLGFLIPGRMPEPLRAR